MRGTSIDQVRTELPAGYRKQVTFDPSRNGWFAAGAIALGIALLLVVGWLQMQFLDSLRPDALNGLRFDDIATEAASGRMSFALPLPLIGSVIAALILVLFMHELVHGLFYWWFAGKRPKLGMQGPLLYTTAPSGVYFPRRLFLVVGLAPLLLLNSVGMLATIVAPTPLVSALLVFCALNAAGSAGDLLMVAWLLYRPSCAFVEDDDAGVVVYAPTAEPAD